jgi:hypothetical protein
MYAFHILSTIFQWGDETVRFVGGREQDRGRVTMRDAEVRRVSVDLAFEPKPIAVEGDGAVEIRDQQDRRDAGQSRDGAILGPEHRPPRASDEPGFEQERHDLGLGDRLAVEALDRQPLAVAGLDALDQCREGGPKPALVRVAQREERAAATLDEKDCLASEEDDLGARDPGRTAGGALRPRQGRAVRLGRIGGGEHERLRLLAFLRPQLPEPLDGATEGELRTAEALDEVAATAEPEGLECAQLAVDGPVAALDSFGPYSVAGDDALSLEEQLCQCATI